jgi:hypothetical protein
MTMQELNRMSERVRRLEGLYQRAARPQPFAPKKIVNNESGIPFINQSGETIPPYGLFVGRTSNSDGKITAYKPGFENWKISKGGHVLMFNGPNAVEHARTGSAQDSEPYIGRIDVSSRYIHRPNVSNTQQHWLNYFGPVAGSWALAGYNHGGPVPGPFALMGASKVAWPATDGGQGYFNGKYPLFMRPTITPVISYANTYAPNQQHLPYTLTSGNAIVQDGTFNAVEPPGVKLPGRSPLVSHVRPFSTTPLKVTWNDSNSISTPAPTSASPDQSNRM